MSTKARTPAKKSAKPARKARAPRYTDAMLADDAEAMLAEIVESGNFRSAWETLADDMRRAKVLGLGPRSEGRPLLYRTATMIMNIHDTVTLFAGVVEQARAAERPGEAKRAK